MGTSSPDVFGNFEDLPQCCFQVFTVCLKEEIYATVPLISPPDIYMKYNIMLFYFFVFICAKNARDFHVPFLGSMCGRFSAQFESFVKPYPQVRSTDSKDVWFLLCNYFGKAFKNLCNISDHVFITLCHKRHSHPPLISILESKSIKSFVVMRYLILFLDVSQMT